MRRDPLALRLKNLLIGPARIDITGKGVDLDRLTKVSRKRKREPACDELVATEKRHALHEHGLQVVAYHDLRIGCRLQALLRPSATNGHMG